MSEPATTRMSSKGQVVIPEEIRNRLKRAGMKKSDVSAAVKRVREKS